MANILRKLPDLNPLLSTVNVFVIRLGGNVLSALRVHVSIRNNPVAVPSCRNMMMLKRAGMYDMFAILR